MVHGHDTHIEALRLDLQELPQLSKADRYELLADLHRDDATSDAGFVLLPQLLKLIPSLSAEAQLDVLYIIARIQIDCHQMPEDEVFGAETYLAHHYITLVEDGLNENIQHSTSEADKEEILVTITKLKQIALA